MSLVFMRFDERQQSPQYDMSYQRPRQRRLFLKGTNLATNLK